MTNVCRFEPCIWIKNIQISTPTHPFFLCSAMMLHPALSSLMHAETYAGFSGSDSRLAWQVMLPACLAASMPPVTPCHRLALYTHTRRTGRIQIYRTISNSVSFRFSFFCLHSFSPFHHININPQRNPMKIRRIKIAGKTPIPLSP